MVFLITGSCKPLKTVIYTLHCLKALWILACAMHGPKIPVLLAFQAGSRN